MSRKTEAKRFGEEPTPQEIMLGQLDVRHRAATHRLLGNRNVRATAVTGGVNRGLRRTTFERLHAPSTPISPTALTETINEVTSLCETTIKTLGKKDSKSSYLLGLYIALTNSGDFDQVPFRVKSVYSRSLLIEELAEAEADLILSNHGIESGDGLTDAAFYFGEVVGYGIALDPEAHKKRILGEIPPMPCYLL